MPMLGNSNCVIHFTLNGVKTKKKIVKLKTEISFHLLEIMRNCNKSKTEREKQKKKKEQKENRMKSLLLHDGFSLFTND